MSLGDLFVCTTVLDGGPGLGKAEVVDRLASLLAEAGYIPLVDVPAILAAVLCREQLGSTAIGNGLAIPHTKHATVSRPLSVLAVCRPPVEFDSLDGEPVDIVALCLFPSDQPWQHLGEASRGSWRLLRHLADADFCRRLRQARSAEEIEDLAQAAGGGMTRREWLACTDPTVMLRLLEDRRVLTERKARLFGAACCRRLWGLLDDKDRRAVKAVERLAARGVFTGVGQGSGPGCFAHQAVWYLLAVAVPNPAGYARLLSAWTAQGFGDQPEEWAAQAGILRCLFGLPPFRAAAVMPEWLAFGDSVVPRLARGINEEGAFDRMPILADALEEAGMTNAAILGHLRGPGPHCRGCHVLDLLLGGE